MTTMTQKQTADVIIIGGGVAGLSTAMQLAGRGASVLVLERERLGNAEGLPREIETGVDQPGDPEGLPSPTLVTSIQRQLPPIIGR